MKIVRILAVLLLASITLSAFAEPVVLSEREYLLPSEVVSLQQTVVYLDVRSDKEWNEGHIKGAVHIPFKEVPARIASVLPVRATPVVVYCGSGGRARAVIKAMRDLGYTAVPVLKGGYKQLVAAGLEKEE